MASSSLSSLAFSALACDSRRLLVFSTAEHRLLSFWFTVLILSSNFSFEALTEFFKVLSSVSKEPFKASRLIEKAVFE